MARIILALIGLFAALNIALAQQFDAYAEVEKRVDRVYADTLAEYDDAIAAQPGNVALAVQRCQVSDAFVYATEYYVAGADEDAAACYDQLLGHYPGLLAAEIASLSEMGSEEAIAVIERLHASNLWAWNSAQHARLHETMALHYGYSEDGAEQHAIHCIKALQFDRSANCRIVAAQFLAEHADVDQAIAILSSPLDPHTETYYILQKLALLSELGAADAVREQYSRIDFAAVGDYQYVELASQLADAGLKYEAMAALNKVGIDYWDHDQLARAKYDVSLAIGDYDAALMNYNLMRDLGMHTDPFLRTRIELATYDAGLAWQARDLLAIFPLLGVTLLIAGLTWTVPALVHYRGLARRARALAPGLLSGQWSLRHAWYVLFSIALGSILTLFIFEYDVLIVEFDLESMEMADWSQVDIVRLLIAESFIVPVFLIPLLLGRERLRQFWTRGWSIARCIGTAFAAALLLRIVYLIPAYFLSDYIGAGQAMTTEESIAAMYAEHGALATYLLIALLTPLVEEFMFRGVLLQGFAQHITYRWANVLQALIFASLHDNLVALPLLFAFGLVAGILTRKAGGLLPAVVLHVFFNITAIVAITA